MDQAKGDKSSLDGTFQELKTITLKQLIPEARDILLQHGCTMHEKRNEETLITFPEGTKRQTIWPRTISERYRILLPDGLELRQVEDRFQQVSQLFIVLENMP
jgi:hypothetical protein